MFENSQVLEVKLNKGVALVSEEDYELVREDWWTQKDWHSNQYAYRKNKGKMLFMHRFILGLVEGEIPDHVNGNGLDNRRENLRICTNEENQRNTVGRRKRLSKYKGVWLSKAHSKFKKKWVAQVGKEKLGLFYTEEEAAKAYDEYAKIKFGAFARPNF